MLSIIFLFLFVGQMNTGNCKSRQEENNYFGPFQAYPQPVNLPLLPQYEIDIPEQEGKRFGGVAATRYETITVRETVRPVCLYVDGNVPSCDHYHDHYDSRPKDAMASNGRRSMTTRDDDYDSYFIEPSKPNVKIETTEIPFRGTYILTDTAVEPGEEHAAAVGGQDETPPLQRTSDRGRRQILQNVISTVTGLGTSVTGLANVAGLGNVAGLVTGAGGLLQNNVVGMAAGVVGAGHGNRNQVTVYVTRVDRVLDDHVTVTLVPKNCVPGGSHLRPCGSGDPYAVGHPYAADAQAHRPQRHDDEPETKPDLPEHPETKPDLPDHPPSVVAADVVSIVDGLVRQYVDRLQTTAAGDHGYRYHATTAAFGDPFNNNNPYF